MLYEVLGSAGWGGGTVRSGERPLGEVCLLAAMATGTDCIETMGELDGVGVRVCCFSSALLSSAAGAGIVGARLAGLAVKMDCGDSKEAGGGKETAEDGVATTGEVAGEAAVDETRGGSAGLRL
jgi:hypothetical protein